MTFVSLIIPAHQVNDWFEECLRLVHPSIQSYSDYEVIVISDNSTEVVEYVEENYPDYKIGNTLFEGFGAAKARNMGAELSSEKCDMLLFLDSDCLAPNDHIERFAKSYIPDCLFVGAIYYMADDMTTVLQPEYRNIWHNPKAERFETIYGLQHYCQYYTGNAGVCKKSFLGFDERFYGQGGHDTWMALCHLEKYGQLKYVFSAVKHRGLTTSTSGTNKVYDKTLHNELVTQFFLDNPQYKNYMGIGSAEQFRLLQKGEF